MKNNRRFLFLLLAALNCILLLNACGPSGQGSGTDGPDSVPAQSEIVVSQPLESEPSSVEPSPTAEPSLPMEPSPTVEVIASGVCGENATWTLDAEGTLTISGDGAMYDYMAYATGSTNTCDDSSQFTPPWNEHYDNQRIKMVIIEPGITSIGVGAFMMCPNLANVSIPPSVIKVDRSAFADCPKLTSIELPSGVTELGSWAFTGCTGLTSASLPNSLKQVGEVSFSGCTNMSELHIMGTSVSFGKDAFFDCRNLSEINYSGTERQWKDAKLNAVDFGSKDYTIQFSDGNSYHYVYQEPMSQDEAQVFAYRYWGVDPDEATEFGSDIWPADSGGAIEWHGRTYYYFKRFGVGTDTYVWASKNEDIWYIFIDAQTGAALLNMPD